MISCQQTAPGTQIRSDSWPVSVKEGTWTSSSSSHLFFTLWSYLSFLASEIDQPLSLLKHAQILKSPELWLSVWVAQERIPPHEEVGRGLKRSFASRGNRSSIPVLRRRRLWRSSWPTWTFAPCSTTITSWPSCRWGQGPSGPVILVCLSIH